MFLCISSYTSLDSVYKKINYHELDLLHSLLMIGLSASFGFCCAVFDEYKEISGKDLEETIASEMSGTLEEAMLAVGMYSVLVFFSKFIRPHPHITLS